MEELIRKRDNLINKIKRFQNYVLIENNLKIN